MSGSAAAVAIRGGDDTDLVAAVRRGDDRAFEQLYQRYHARIAAYVRGMVKDHARAEDVTQEVFFSALRRMRETERPIAFKPWIYEIARNACIDAFRRGSRAEELSYDAEGVLATADHLRLVSSDPAPDAAVESKQRLDDLCGAFGGLSETHHQVLVLRELEGLSYREIGERLGMSRAAVESTLFRARRRLTEEYDELVSGRRCVRVQAIIDAAAGGMLGARDQRRLARHVASCQACRVHARQAGVEVAARPSLPSRLAALLPIPAFLRRSRGHDSGGSAGGAAGSHASGLMAQVSSTLGAAADPVAASWTKAVAAVAALAFAGVGAGVASHNGVAIPGLSHLPIVGKSDSKHHHADRNSSGGSGGGSGTLGGGGSAGGATGGGSGGGGASGGSSRSSGSGAAHDAGASSGSGGGAADTSPTGSGDSAGNSGVSAPSTSLPSTPEVKTPSVSVPDADTSGTGTGDTSLPSTPQVSVPSKVETPSVTVPSTSTPSTPSTPSVDTGSVDTGSVGLPG